jgi:chromosome segregation ATPase
MSDTAPGPDLSEDVQAGRTFLEDLLLDVINSAVSGAEAHIDSRYEEQKTAFDDLRRDVRGTAGLARSTAESNHKTLIGLSGSVDDLYRSVESHREDFRDVTQTMAGLLEPLQKVRGEIQSDRANALKELEIRMGELLAATSQSHRDDVGQLELESKALREAVQELTESISVLERRVASQNTDIARVETSGQGLSRQTRTLGYTNIGLAAVVIALLVLLLVR